jgi:hypothetical protein
MATESAKSVQRSSPAEGYVLRVGGGELDGPGGLDPGASQR